MSERDEGSKARVVFLFTVSTERTEDFLRAYDQIRYEVAGGVPGHLMDQVCQSATDPEQWLITSEWASIGHFEAWERSPEHRTLVRPMRVCMENPTSLRFTIRTQTAKGDAVAQPDAAGAGLTDDKLTDAELIDAVGEK
jgi:heme-degrading monooxygenase HmoA